MEAKAKITVTGPVRDGVQRGVEYMDVGFIQLSTNRVLHVPVKSGNLNDVLNHFVEGGTDLLDSITKTCQGNVRVVSPWYDAFNKNGEKYTGYFSGDTNEQYNESVIRELRIEDTPVMPLPLTFWSNNRVWIPKSMNLDWAFSTFIGVHTHAPDVYESEDPEKSETKKYTQRAFGRWSFHGTGTIQYAANGDPVWTAAGAGVMRNQQIEEIMDGSKVPAWTTPPRVLNDVLTGWTKVVNGRRVPNDGHN